MLLKWARLVWVASSYFILSLSRAGFWMFWWCVQAILIEWNPFNWKRGLELHLEQGIPCRGGDFNFLLLFQKVKLTFFTHYSRWNSLFLPNIDSDSFQIFLRPTKHETRESFLEGGQRIEIHHMKEGFPLFNKISCPYWRKEEKEEREREKKTPYIASRVT